MSHCKRSNQMTKLRILILTLVLTIGVILNFLQASDVYTKKTIELDVNNSITLRGEISESSVSKVISEFLKLKKNNPEKVYLVIDSGGGSVSAGEDLINFLKTQKIVSIICMDCYSMAHAILQASINPRLVIETNKLMAHRATVGLQGQIGEGELESRLGMVKELVKNMETRNAKRIKVSLETYRKKAKDEWWTVGQQSITQNIADKIVSISCTDELMEQTETITKTIFIFQVESIYSKCPLIRSPLMPEKKPKNQSTIGEV